MMRAGRKYLLNGVLTFIIALSLIACDRTQITSVSAPENYPADNYNDIFEGFWNGMNTNYVFWENDTIDWDKMYSTYKPLFSQLKTFNEADNLKAEHYFREMTSNLIDSHFSINFNFTGNRFTPSFYRKTKIDEQYPDSIYELPPDFFTTLVANNYIDNASLVIGTDSILIEGSKAALTAVTGTLNNSILYLYFSNFFFSQAGQNVRTVLDNYFTAIHSLAPNIKGIIIDLRGNGGGEVTDLDYFLGSMIRSNLTFGYTRSKNGPGRLDYTPWIPAIVSTQPGAVSIHIPIVVLADHFSVSMAELTTLAIKTLNNGTFVGTTTWGANGPLEPSVYFTGGQFTVGGNTGNGGYMSVTTSSAMFRYWNGAVYEGKGVKPDIWVPETPEAYQQGRDLQLETAISYINK